MEQQNSAPGAAVSQAARTVLPGEPFDAPASSQVPGPRPPEQQQAAPEPVPHWNYQPVPPVQAAYGAPTQEEAPVPGMTFINPTPTAYPVDGSDNGGDFASLHEYASLPVAEQGSAPAGYPQPTGAPQEFAPAAFPPPAPDSSWPPAAPLDQPQAFGAAFPPPQQYNPSEAPPLDAPLPPLPPAPAEDEQAADGGHRRGKRNIDKRLLALVGVVVIAGGGYFAYSHFDKSSSSTASSPIPTAVVPAAPVVKYDFPSNVAGFNLQTPAQSAQLRLAALAQLKSFSPVAARTMSFASFGKGNPNLTAVTYRPGPANVVASYNAFVAFISKPGAGDVTVPGHSAVTGAAGGTMFCGGQRGASPASYCIWHNSTTVGVMTLQGSPKTQITEIVTRELRAYAEH